MTLPEIILIIVISLFVAFIFGREIFNHLKGNSSECSCCKNNMKRAMEKAKKALDKGKNML